MRCEYSKKKYMFCEGYIKGRIKYINGIRVCSRCFSHLNRLRKKEYNKRKKNEKSNKN